MRFGLKSAVVGAAAFAVLMASGSAIAKLSDLTPGSDAQKNAAKCVATIQKEGSKYAAAHMKLIIKCKSGVLKGKGGTLAGCNPLTGDLAAKDAGNAGKLGDKIAGKCCGKDKTCGVGVGDEADIPLADISWDIGACPPLESNDPGISISDASDIAPCIVAQAQFANHQVANDITADLLDDSIFGAGADPGKTNNKCQQTAFKEVTKFALAKAKILLKCWTAKTKLKGDDFSDGDPCPATDVVKAKTKAGIEKSELKLAAALCKKCGGTGDSDKDGTCDDPGADIIAPVGPVAAPFACPSVVVPPCTGAGCPVHHYDVGGDPSDGVDCGSIGGGSVDTIQEYIDCLTCVTEFKADCMGHLANGDDPGLGMVYPAECGVAECGNGVLDPGESCDPGGGAATNCPNGGNGLQTCNVDCTCDCPTIATFEADPNDAGSNLDTGFTGFAHDSKVIGLGVVSITLGGGDQGVAGKRDPNCGEVVIGGPIQNPSAGAGQPDVVRCSQSSDVPCTDDSDCPDFNDNCTGAGVPDACCTGSGTGTCLVETCETYFGSRLPLSAGGVSACVTNRFTAPIVGTANLENGTSANSVSISSEVVVGPSVDKPCDNCIGDLFANDGSLDGTCDTGTRAGLACDVMGVSPIPAFNGGVPGGGTINGTSLDCPQSPAGANVGVLPINLSNSTGTEALTVSATGPTCTASGFGGSTCMCDTCANGDPCNEDADCGGGAGSCGTLRCLGGVNANSVCTTAGIGDPVCSGVPCGNLGEPTKPNNCSDATCTGGDCLAGPFPGFCGPTETFRGCLAPSDCPFAGDTCVFGFQPCFQSYNGTVGDTISGTGIPSPPVNDVSTPKLASAFCVAPVGAASINTATGLPGPGLVTLQGTATGLP